MQFYIKGSEAAYREFLRKTDYISSKISDALFLGTELDKDYTEVLQARKFAREQVDLLTAI